MFSLGTLKRDVGFVYVPNSEEWEKADNVCQFLAFFNDVTNIYEPSKGVNIITITICENIEIQNRFALNWLMKYMRGHKSHFSY